MALHLDAVGICPAVLAVDPMTPSDETFERVARAAAAAGFAEFSLWSFWPTAYGTDRARALLDSFGIRVPVLEAATQWARGPAAAKDEAAGLVSVASELGADMVASCVLEPVIDSWSDAVAGFATLCDAAGAAGLGVCIEFLPCTAIPDLATAWRMVEESGADNGGILVDMMHWHRQPGGPDFGLLEQIPGARIPYVQVCDTATAPAMPDAYMDEALSARRLPGEGAVDIPRLLAALEATGANPWFAYEVFSRELVATGPEAAARTLAACHVG